MSCKFDWMTSGDIGVDITILVKECSSAYDLSTATEAVIVFTSPYEEVTEKAADITLPNEVTYTTVDGDFQTVGTWEMRAKITFTGGAVLKTAPVTFQVVP